QNHTDEKIALVFCLAPWRENKMLFRLSLNLFFFAYIAVLVHVTMCSLYRYALLCNKNLQEVFETRWKLTLVCICLGTFFVFWLYSLSGILTDDVKLSKDVIVTMRKIYNVDLTRAAVVGNTLEDIGKQPLAGKMAFISILTFIFVFVTGCCGYAIHATLQGKAMSPKTKKIHSKALTLLMAQFALPILFLHMPTFLFECYSLIIREKIPLFIKVYIRILLTYYPVADATFLTDDFRNYSLSSGRNELRIVPLAVSPSPLSAETSPS
ncbi:hypothetical protein PENTCL1PPCAC_11046, partial [Pristionchus entomophagus]